MNTLPKSSMDAKNDGLEEEFPASLLDFWCILYTPDKLSITITLPETKHQIWMIGRLVSFYDGFLAGAMLLSACVCSRLFFTSYHGKSPLNYHLGICFQPP